MAHVPERPRQFICMDCQVIHAGTVSKGKGTSNRYDPPTSCRACGGTDLVLDGQYPRLAMRRLVGSR